MLLPAWSNKGRPAATPKRIGPRTSNSPAARRASQIPCVAIQIPSSLHKSLYFVRLIVNQMIAFVNRFIYNSPGMVTERRTYTLRKRAWAAEDTRQRIIAAAQALFAEAGYPNVSLDDIAARAGVSRQTIYVQFGAKNGVLRAVVEHIEQAQFGDVQAGLQRTTDPVDSVRSGIGIQITFFSAHADLLRTFYAQ